MQSLCATGGIYAGSGGACGDQFFGSVSAKAGTGYRAGISPGIEGKRQPDVLL